MSLRTLAVVLPVLGVGCQCLEPVAELVPDAAVDGGRRDGGLDGGLDAGLDGGADGGLECRLATDCALKAPDGGAFACLVGFSMSCLDNRCVAECNGGRTCRVSDGGACLSCQGSSPVCSPSACSAIFSCRMTVTDSTCRAGPVTGRTWDATRNPDCSRTVTADGGALTGRWWDLSNGQSVGAFDGVDGFCVGRDLFTGVPRMQWSCPGGCTFTEEGCE